MVGRVLRPHGIRGELKVEVLSDVPERFDAGAELVAVGGDGAVRQVVVERARPVAGGLLLVLAGIADRDAAESFRGARFEIGLDQVPPLDEGYYHFQLIGCRCVDEGEGELGTVLEVIEDGGGTLLLVADGPLRRLLPFVGAHLRRVDVAERRIDLLLPPGLVAACTSLSTSTSPS